MNCDGYLLLLLPFLADAPDLADGLVECHQALVELFEGHLSILLVVDDVEEPQEPADAHVNLLGLLHRFGPRHAVAFVVYLRREVGGRGLSITIKVPD